MESKQPLLSICIPTYNRANVLKKSLEAYVNNSYFDNDVEIIISDNASTDDTKYVCECFTQKYCNIKYYRNNKNINDSNFPLALDYGTGRYLKLMNDSTIIRDYTLLYLKDCIKMYEEYNKPIFFTNGVLFNHKREEFVECKSFEDYILYISYFVTSNPLFGCWKKDWINVVNRTRCTKLKLNQSDWTYQLLENNKSAILCTKTILDQQIIGKRSGYNWFEIHVTNYYTILQDYVDKGLVTKKIIRKEKETYLKHLKSEILMSLGIKVIPDWDFDFSGTWKILWKHFWNVPFFYILILTLPIWGGWKSIKLLIKSVLGRI